MLPQKTVKKKLITCPECKGRGGIRINHDNNTSNHYIFNFLTTNAPYHMRFVECPTCRGLCQLVEITTKTYSLNLEEANEL